MADSIFIMLKYTFIILALWINLALANPLAINAMDEAILLACQATGHTLYFSCVVKPPTTPDEVAACETLKASYELCLAKLTVPLVLTPSHDPDPYVYSRYTPCTFETGHLILFDICPSLP